MKKKQVIIIIIAVLVLVGVGLGIFFSQKKSKVAEQPQKKEELGAIPTVDASTVVTLSALPGNKEIVLKSIGTPNGTSSVEYELSYNTKSQGLQGAMGTISNLVGNTFERQITLGTCSSGRCVYHEVIGGIQVTLKFTGEYGEKVLSKEFTL